MRKGLLIAGTIIAAITMCITTAAAEKTEGEWILEQTVDDFGDVTDDSETVIKTTTSGTFSNTATTEGDLNVVVWYYPGEYPSFYFRLLEYGNTPAVYYENSDMRILFKVNDVVYEHCLAGDSPNGDVVLSDWGEIQEQHKEYQKKIENKEVSENEALDLYSKMREQINDPNLPYRESGVKQMLHFLSDKENVRCVIYLDSSKYSFTIPSDGFLEIVNPFLEEQYEQAQKLFEANQYDEAQKAFSKMEGYADAAQRVAECRELIIQQESEYQYNKAKALMEDKDYMSAYSLFNTIPEYKDTNTLMNECLEGFPSQAFSMLISMYKGDFSSYDTVQSLFDLVSKVSPYLSSEEILGFFNGTLLRLSYKPSTLEIDDIGDQPHIQFVEYECADSLQVETGVGNVADDGRYVYNKIREDRLEYFTDEIIVENGIRHGAFHQDFQFVKLNDNTLLEILLLDGGPTPISILIKTDTVPTNSEEQDLRETIEKYTEEKQPDEDGENAVSKEESDTSSVSVDKNVIISVQAALNEKGYDCGTPDGDKGPKTTSVIQQYQTDNGLEATGEIDDALLTSLGIQ